MLFRSARLTAEAASRDRPVHVVEADLLAPLSARGTADEAVDLLKEGVDLFPAGGLMNLPFHGAPALRACKPNGKARVTCSRTVKVAAAE